MATQQENIQMLLAELSRPGLNPMQRQALTAELQANQASPNVDAQRSAWLAANPTAIDTGVAKTAGYKPFTPNTTAQVTMRPESTAVQPTAAIAPEAAAGAPTGGGVDFASLLATTMQQQAATTEALQTARIMQQEKVATLNSERVAATDVRNAQTAQKVAKQNDVLAQYGFGTGADPIYAQFTDAQAKTQALAGKVAELDSINPLKNPLSWLLGQVQRATLVEQHNTVNAALQGSAQAITHRQQWAHNALTLDPKMTQVQAEELAAVDRKALIAEGEAKLAELKVQDAKDELSGTRQQLQVLATVGSQENAAKRITQSQTEAEARATRAQAAMDAKEAARVAKEAGTPAAKLREQEIQLRLDMLAAKNAEDTQVANVVEMVTGNPATGVAFSKAEKHPLRPLAQSFGATGRFGDDMPSAFANAKVLGLSANKAGSQKLRNAAALVEHYSAKAESITTTRMADGTVVALQKPKNAKEEAAMNERKLLEAVSEDQNAVARSANTVTSATNPFIIREGQVLTLPEMQNNLFAKALKAQVQVSASWNHNESAKLMSDLLVSGRASPADLASSVYDFYSAGLKDQAELSGQNMLAIMPTKAYTFTGMFESTKTGMLGGVKYNDANVLNRAQLEKVFMEVVAKSRSTSLKAVGTSFMFP
jgi:hypothetical protein